MKLSGFVLLVLYSAMVSRDIASREYWSFLPLYLSWIFLICGAIAIILRWLLNIRSVTGMSAARTTSTRPRIDRIQVMPAAGSIPTAGQQPVETDQQQLDDPLDGPEHDAER